MNRKGFISNLLTLGGIAVIPKFWIQSYTKVYLLQCFVAGFQYYKGPGLLKTLKKGDLIDLVREPANLHDRCAIALHLNNQKIGFIPAKENKTLSRLIDSETINIMAEITHIEIGASFWENIHIAIFLLKSDEKPLAPHAEYLTELEYPTYKTLKSKEKVFKIMYEGEYFSSN